VLKTQICVTRPQFFNTTEPAKDISLTYVAAITNEVGIPRLPG